MAAQAGACLGALLSCVHLSHRQQPRKHPACATGACPCTNRLAGHWGTCKALQPERRALTGGLFSIGGSSSLLSFEAAACRRQGAGVLFAASGMCFLWRFCSKPRLALVKWLD